MSAFINNHILRKSSTNVDVSAFCAIIKLTVKGGCCSVLKEMISMNVNHGTIQVKGSNGQDAYRIYYFAGSRFSDP